MKISAAEAKQQRRQRQAELEEAATRNAKTRMNLETTREGIGVVHDGVHLIHSIRGLF